MLRILKNWSERYFSDEEAVYLLVVLLAAGLVILFFGGMLAPVLAAIVIAYLMQGLVAGLERRGMRRLLAVNLVFTLFLGLLVVTLVLLLPMVWRQTLLLVQDQLPHLLKNGETWLRQLPEHYPEVISMEQVNSIVAVIQRQVAEAGQGVLTLSLSSIPNLVEIMVFLVLLPLLVFFFLKDREAIIAWMMRFLPRRRRILDHVWHEMDDQIANYVRGKAIEILLVGSVTFIAFLLLGMHYTVLLAVLVGLSVLIPYIGAGGGCGLCAVWLERRFCSGDGDLRCDPVCGWQYSGAVAVFGSGESAPGSDYHRDPAVRGDVGIMGGILRYSTGHLDQGGDQCLAQPGGLPGPWGDGAGRYIAALREGRGGAPCREAAP